QTVEDIVSDRDTPSINTVKRALRRGPVFIDTLERIWDYLQRCAQEKKETLPDLLDGEDYAFVESTQKAVVKAPQNRVETLASGSRRGWISHQTPRPNRL